MKFGFLFWCSQTKNTLFDDATFYVGLDIQLCSYKDSRCHENILNINIYDIQLNTGFSNGKIIFTGYVGCVLFRGCLSEVKTGPLFFNLGVFEEIENAEEQEYFS